jgi:hypothetical protein
MSGNKAAGFEKQRTGLLDKRDTGRSAYGRLGHDATAVAPVNLEDLLGSEEPTAREQTAAYADALGRQMEHGRRGMMSGDPVLAQAGQSYIQDAQHRMDKMGDFRQAMLDRAAKASQTKSTADAAGAKGRFDMTEGLRKELMGNQVTKETQDLASAHAKLQPSFANPSAAGDLGIVFGIMKMYDPGSSVKEGEQATAANAAGVPATIRNSWNAMLTGQRLSPEIRADFAQQADDLYGAQIGRYDALAGQYGGLADRFGVSRDDVALDLGFKRPAKRTRPGAPAELAPEKKSVLDGLRKKKAAEGGK